MRLETKSLILREFEDNDFDKYFSFTGDIETVKYVPWGPFDEEQARAKLAYYAAKRAESPRSEFQLAVCEKGSDDVVGFGILYSQHNFTEAMIGYVLHKDFWRKGYTTELAAALIRFGFEELKLHRIYAICDDRNAGSYKVMEKNKMRREGHNIKNSNIRGEWRNEYLYAILAEEYHV